MDRLDAGVTGSTQTPNPVSAPDSAKAPGQREPPVIRLFLLFQRRIDVGTELALETTPPSNY